MDGKDLGCVLVSWAYIARIFWRVSVHDIWYAVYLFQHWQLYPQYAYIKPQPRQSRPSVAGQFGYDTVGSLQNIRKEQVMTKNRCVWHTDCTNFPIQNENTKLGRFWVCIAFLVIHLASISQKLADCLTAGTKGLDTINEGSIKSSLEVQKHQDGYQFLDWHCGCSM